MIPTDAEYYSFSCYPDFMFFITCHGNAIEEKTPSFFIKTQKNVQSRLSERNSHKNGTQMQIMKIICPQSATAS